MKRELMVSDDIFASFVSSSTHVMRKSSYTFYDEFCEDTSLDKKSWNDGFDKGIEYEKNNNEYSLFQEKWSGLEADSVKFSDPKDEANYWFLKYKDTLKKVEELELEKEKLSKRLIAANGSNFVENNIPSRKRTDNTVSSKNRLIERPYTPKYDG